MRWRVPPKMAAILRPSERKAGFTETRFAPEVEISPTRKDGSLGLVVQTKLVRISSSPLQAGAAVLP